MQKLKKKKINIQKHYLRQSLKNLKQEKDFIFKKKKTNKNIYYTLFKGLDIYKKFRFSGFTTKKNNINKT